MASFLARSLRDTPLLSEVGLAPAIKKIIPVNTVENMLNEHIFDPSHWGRYLLQVGGCKLPHVDR